MDKFKKFLDELGLKIKEEIAMILTINILFLATSLFVFLTIGQITLLIFIVMFWLMSDYLLFYRYSRYKMKLINNNEREFVVVLSYLKIYLQNGFNVYRSFEEILIYCSLRMKKRIETFLMQIDEDKSVKPFLNFAKNFSDPLVEQVMMSIFLMIDIGSKDEFLLRFTPLFNDLTRMNHEDFYKKKERIFDTLNLFPLIGAAIITMTIIVSIASIIGGIVNGI